MTPSPTSAWTRGTSVLNSAPSRTLRDLPYRGSTGTSVASPSSRIIQTSTARAGEAAGRLYLYGTVHAGDGPSASVGTGRLESIADLDDRSFGDTASCSEWIGGP